MAADHGLSSVELVMSHFVFFPFFAPRKLVWGKKEITFQRRRAPHSQIHRYLVLKKYGLTNKKKEAITKTKALENNFKERAKIKL